MSGCVDNCIDWPCPDLGCFCFPAVQPDQVAAALRKANRNAFEWSNKQFPGCGCLVKLRPCKPCICVCPCTGACTVDRIDLFPTVHHPVHEIVDMEINGQPADFNGWRIDGNRWLVRDAGSSWPQQILQLVDGEECTWSITVRYGTTPPQDVLDARDELFQSELDKCAPAGVSACAPGTLVEVSDKTGTYRRKQPDPYTTLFKRYGQRRRRALHLDPLDTKIGTGATIVVVETQPPTEPCCDPDTFAAAWAATIVDSNPVTFAAAWAATIVDSNPVTLDEHGLPVGGQ